MKNDSLGYRSTSRCRRFINRGFTLIELVIAIVVLGFLAAVGASMFSSSFSLTAGVDAKHASTGQARYAVERLEREIREIQYSDPTYTVGDMTPNKFVFTKDNGTIVTIELNAGNLTICYGAIPCASPQTLHNQVIANPGGVGLLTYYQANGTSLATDGSNLRFVQFYLSVTDANGQTLSQRSRVSLRNSG